MKHRKSASIIGIDHSEPGETAYHLSQAFVSMLSERHDRNLDEWLGQAKHSGIAELNSFAQGLRRDYAAVRATFSSPWSNDHVA